jgi:hypothetical protein
MLTINCLLVTNTCNVLGDAFVVKLPADESVEALRDEVCKMNASVIPHQLPSHYLIPWKPNPFPPVVPCSKLEEHVRNLNLNSEENCAATEMDPTLELKHYFPQPLPTQHVHIVLRILNKRPSLAFRANPPQVEFERDDFDNLLRYLGVSRYVQDSPSFISKPGEFQGYQDTGYRILNDRPSKDVKLAPITLQYPPFGQFFDDIAIAECPKKNLQRFKFAVEDFASVMIKHFKDEKERQKEVLPALNEIFASYGPYTLPPISPGKIVGERTSDGHANGPVEAMEVILDIQNEFGSGSTDPEIRYTSYFVQMYESQIRSGRYRECFEKYICPALGISIIGIRRGFLYYSPVLILSFQVQT